MNDIAICLPKKQNLNKTANMLKSISFPVIGYTEDNRSYRIQIEMENVRGKILNEEDIVTQVAIGNYDMGICGSDHVQEYLAKFKDSSLKVLKNIAKTGKKIYACCHLSIEKSHNWEEYVSHFNQNFLPMRIVSEYPHLSETFAISHKIQRYVIFPSKGRTENYPPEHAEIVILPITEDMSINALGLKPLDLILDTTLCVIINQKKYESKDLSSVIDYFAKLENKL
ncbi:MAG: ATP phosphoribosyltransferase [Leptospiraceae bacterium]|nr:ATP phosphoribosyltransferase [Leptospiraceae bacterium]MCP5493029.1 ATP phosphoribosyltransferase [Leptospiraceae bacterium]